MLDQLAHALSLRGFLITKMDDHIYFSRGNHEEELSELEEMFKKVNIAVRVDGRKIYLLDGDITKKTWINSFGIVFSKKQVEAMHGGAGDISQLEITDLK
ncbi:hypothetical protein QF028_002668 [Neobacillus sp. B4I6]|uniref:hypothetical protein n=1 Tax=Neobacillus sp. B4I6 TaxID=3373925 RepID=UPI003D1ECF2F